MVSIGMIWNSAQKYEKEIIEDLGSKVNILAVLNQDFGDAYFDFVESLYRKEQMEEWKIKKKITHMLFSSNRNVTIIFFEFDENETYYHPMKQKKVYTQLEACKTEIREKYKNLIPNYTFDIIFHATDDLIELKNCFDILLCYLEEERTKEINKFVRIRRDEEKI